MKKWIKDNKSFFIKLCVIVFMLVWFIILTALKANQDICESYSRGFGRVLNTIFSAISKYFPISVFECFVIAMVSLTIFWLVGFIKDFKKKNIIKGFSKIANMFVILTSVITLLTATMQLQYNRKAVPIPLYEEKVEKTEFMTIITHFLDDYNDCASKLKFKDNGEVISPYSLMEINYKLAKEFNRLNEPRFNNYFNKFNYNVKPLMSSELYSHLQITGITVGAFGEANVNTAAPNAGIPFVMAHEIAHTKGTLREDDANLVALFLTLTSEDYYLRYSGYFYSFARLMSLASLTGNEDDYGQIYWGMDENIRKCYGHNNKYWDDHDIIGDIGEWFNNLYLKTSGTEGTSSYDDTETKVDEETEIVISFSTYQKLYFQIYFNEQ